MRHVKDKLFSQCRRVVCLVDNLGDLSKSLFGTESRSSKYESFVSPLTKKATQATAANVVELQGLTHLLPALAELGCHTTNDVKDRL
jgi:hypothetical protein